MCISPYRIARLAVAKNPRKYVSEWAAGLRYENENVKACIVDFYIGLARRYGWSIGVGIDEKAPIFRGVIYIETPRGQISFHVGLYDPRIWDHEKSENRYEKKAWCGDNLSYQRCLDLLDDTEPVA